LIVNSPALAGGILFALADTEVARFHATTGRFGIGTGSTDSGALLQLSTNALATTSAYGIVFGTDVQLYRSGAGRLALNYPGNTTPRLALQNDGTDTLIIQTSGAAAFVDAAQTSGTLTLRTNGSTTALTLDSAQAATFSAAAAAGFCAKFNQVAGNNPTVVLQESGVSKAQWATFSGDVYFDSLTAGKSLIFRSAAQVTALTLDSSQNATFAGTITKIGGAFLLATSTALTGGATGNVPTLSTGPVTGNPTKWIAINDNGTTRYVPAW